MRLLHFESDTGRLTWSFFSSDIPPYAIISHTWGDGEVTFEDLVKGTEKSKAGYRKILFCGELATHDHLEYFWVDTCCIDKWNLEELSNAINSMFCWYRNADKCYVLLSDVITTTGETNLDQIMWKESFRNSKWFTRGWTLQELIAPASVEFFSEYQRLGEKQSLEQKIHEITFLIKALQGLFTVHRRLGDKQSLEQEIHEITGIPIKALQGHPLNDFTVAERMAWAESRQTSEPEDGAYCLLGIFDVKMPLIYGEGKEKALNRLLKVVGDGTADTTPFIVPFEQNAQFTGRESQFAELEGKLFVDAQTKVAITGTSGVGKTQLALELAYRTRQKYKCSVFWIPATDMERLLQAYEHIAQRLNIAGWDDEKADVKRLVQRHLSTESAGQWLLIYDNVDDGDLWISESGSSMTQYIPDSEQGRIVFTTREKGIALNLVSENIVEVPEGDHDIAQKMLKSLINRSLIDEREEANILLKELSYLPLAIALAAAYINANDIALKEYRLLLARQEKETIEHLCEGLEDAGQYDRTKHPVATTWLISFEQIRRCNMLAVDYMSFMACIDRKDIPQSLLPVGPSREKGIAAIGSLHAYSMIVKRPTASAIDLHQLVHLITRNWLQNQESLLARWTEAAITRLLDMFPDDNHGNRSKWRRLLPHANYALKFGLIGEGNEARVGLVSKCAISLLSDGRYNEAEAYFLEMVQRDKRVFGEEHPDTLIRMGNLATTYTNQGRGKEAEELEVRVMETFKRVVGEGHPFTLTSIGNLASTYRDQGRWKEAEELDVRVMETRLRVLGEEHPSTLTSMDNLASTYRDQGRWKEAEVLGVRGVEMSVKVLGEEHPDTLISMNNLAWTYGNQGRWKKAEKLNVAVLEIRKRVLGEEHPDTLTSMDNLASSNTNQGRWKEAEELFMRVMETRIRLLGKEHPDTLTTMNNLALTYRYQGRWKEAEKLEVQDMEISLKVLGEEHPGTLTSMCNLASGYENQGRWKEAEGLFVRVIETRKRVLGEEHPSTLISINNLASAYTNQGRWKEAEELFVRVIKARKRILVEEHPDTLTSMNNLASTYRNQGRWKEAEKLEVRVIETRKRMLGEEHPDTLTSMNNLASTYRDQGRQKEAEKLGVRVMETRRRVLGEEHPDTLTSMYHLAGTYSHQGRWKEAEELFMRVVETRRRVLGKEHIGTLTSMASLAFTLKWQQGRLIEAIKLMEECVSSLTLALGADHPHTLSSSAALIAWQTEKLGFSAIDNVPSALKNRPER